MGPKEFKTISNGVVQQIVEKLSQNNPFQLLFCPLLVNSGWMWMENKVYELLPDKCRYFFLCYTSCLLDLHHISSLFNYTCSDIRHTCKCFLSTKSKYTPVLTVAMVCWDAVLVAIFRRASSNRPSIVCRATDKSLQPEHRKAQLRLQKMVIRANSMEKFSTHIGSNYIKNAFLIREFPPITWISK
jgi:hypothetical protein